MPKKIAYLTDLHLDDQYPKDCGADTFHNWEKVLEHLSTQTVDKVIVGGDLGEPHTTTYFLESLKPYEELHLTLGNHDEFAHIVQHFPKAQALQEQQALYYAFEEEGYLYIFLDSSAGQVAPAQVAWLQQQLKSTLPVLLFVHHPILGVEDCLVDELFPLKEREELQKILLDSGLDITIFCGHYHLEHEQIQGNIKQYITPATSVQFDTQAPQLRFHKDSFGYRMIEVGAEGVHSTLYHLEP